jgi:hypothetical protein
VEARAASGKGEKNLKHLPTLLAPFTLSFEGSFEGRPPDRVGMRRDSLLLLSTVNRRLLTSCWRAAGIGKQIRPSSVLPYRRASNLPKEDSMFKRTFQLLLVAGLVTGALWAANDPFVGEWKLVPSKSKLTDQMKVESVAGNKYAFDFGGGPETIAADGTDQPGGYGGTTLSVTIEAPDSWKVVRKKDGHVLLTGNWKLSKDGQTLTDDFTFFAPNGSASNVNYVYKRTAGTSGFAGTWESTSEAVNSVFVIKFQPYEGDGLSIVDSSEGVTKNVKFDGKDYPNVGPNVPAGLVSSARRVNQHTLELTGKFNGKVTDTQEIKLSADGKTLTMTVHAAGRSEPNILVFERQ